VSRSSFWRLMREYTVALLVALVISFLIRSTVVEAYRIPSGSMENTLLVGDRLFANKMIYGATVPFTHHRMPPVRPPQVGDVIIFRSPTDLETPFVKRVVAVAGERVEIRGKQVFVNGRLRHETAGVKHEDLFVIPPIAGTRDFFGPVTVPDGYLFVMGDNRDNSYDSRFWGFLDARLVLGKAELIFWSWDGRPAVPFLDRVRWDRIGHRLG
jgi:signal peptidase I